jgi:hypothetical protein
LALSSLLLLWSFSLPFRQAGSLASSARSAAEIATRDLSHRIEQRRSQAEELREAAIAMDQEFMRSLAKRNAAKSDLPGGQEATARWHRHRQFVLKQVEQLRDAPEGSLEAAYRRELIESLQDDPADSAATPR